MEEKGQEEKITLESDQNKNIEKASDGSKIEAPEEEVPTITPTMIDEESKTEKKRDLSAIIPKSTIQESNAQATLLNSKETELKSDGSVLIGSIDENGDATAKESAKLPEQIDIEQRKKDKDIRTNKKKKKARDKAKITKQKMENKTALLSLVVIALLGVFFYWYKHHPTENDFMPLTVTVELGDSLPIRGKYYVKPGVGNDVDELAYQIDTSNVNIDEVGTYDFTVKYKGILKTGKINIVDTTAPKLKTRQLKIVEGSSYSPEQFVDDCYDLTGCNYSFEDKDTEKKYNTNGAYDVIVVATDAYGNKAASKTRLLIEASGNVYVYKKDTSFNFQTGYSTNEKYELHFADTNNSRKILMEGVYTRTFKYEDEKVYEKARSEYNGELHYKCIDSNMTIEYTESVNQIGGNYAYKDEIDNYLSKQGYTIG